MPIPKLDERDQLAILQTITGCSVTQRIKTVKQPRGGFLNPNLFEETVLDSPDDLALLKTFTLRWSDWLSTI